ncbi:hypothetical protein RvY_10415 [Ramazzottius varieornatus]|uniref:Transcription factor TFIIB cyclin-like domain-containing protein n=1 Tax=Ramazzottius varieornatus TaxID=947166 RepID=A0A1D1VF44_RAMVA|nr:hypothetical protein RvY_10415 [Ramazzottius varieornatus]
MIFKKNRDILRGIATGTKCDEAVVRDAFEVYKKAKRNLMTSGRKNQLLLSACLYIGTRRAQMSHTMSDFLQPSNSTFHELRKTVRDLVLCLSIEMPSQDLVRQVERLCYQLIGDSWLFTKVRDRAETIVQRMKKDWLDSGRKPAGVTAAAIVIASRTFNVEIDLEKLISLAKISIGTVKKRMVEFSKTESAQLVPTEFETSKFERARVHPAVAQRLANDEKATEESLASSDKKEAAKCFKKLLQTIIETSKKGVTGEPMEYLLESLRVFTTAVDIVTRKESMGREKSFIYGTHFTCDGTYESHDFENGSSMVDKDFLNSMFCSNAEQEVRRKTNNQKFGGLLQKRAANKAAKSAPSTPAKQASPAGKPCGNLTNKGKPISKRKTNSFTKLDQEKYEAFLKAQTDESGPMEV